MKFLSNIVRALSKEEARNFRLFSDRIQSANYDKKPLQLYEALRGANWDEQDEQLVTQFYPLSNKNAYYRLKNRLLTDLERSLLMLHYDLDSRIKIMRLLALGRVFQSKSEYALAAAYFHKAQRKAQKEGHLDLALLVCEETLQLVAFVPEIEVPALIKQKTEILSQYQENHRIDGLISIISYHLQQTNFGGHSQELVGQLEQIQQNLELLPEQQTPEMKFRINKCVREVLLEKKDFLTLESYLKESYTEYLHDQLFNATNHKEKIIILAWLANALTKNKKFEESLHYTHLLHEALQEHKKRYYQQYLWTYYQGLVMNYSASGQNKQAIKLLEKLDEEMKPEAIPGYELFVLLNLARLHFNERQYTQATRYLNQLLYRDTFVQLSPPIQLSVSLAEVLLRIEQRDWEYAGRKLQEFKRRFKKNLEEESYAPEKTLLPILQSLIKSMSFLIDEKLIQQMDHFLELAPYEVGSNEMLSYKAWVHGKRYQKDYYSVVMEWLHEE